MNRFNNAMLLTITMVFLALFPVASATASDWKRLDAFVETGMELWHVPGMAVTVVSGNAVLYQQGFGQTAVTDGEKIDEHTLFANASTTKAMVAAGLLMLVDDGKLTLEDPVIKHIPELHFNDPVLTSELTIRDLLVHRTGLPSTDQWTFFQGMPLEEQIGRLSAVPAAAPIRTRHIYQNTMYELAGVVVERASGQRWDQFLAGRLWQPIGMMETFGTRGQITPGQPHVLGYYFGDGQWERADWDLQGDQADAAGSVWSSIHDMALWAQFLLRGGITADGERLISEESVEEMFKPQALIATNDFYPTAALTRPDWTSYGLGWFQQDFQGRKIDFHTGSLAGLVAIIGLDREGDRAVVVMGNRDHAEMRHAVLWEVMDNRPDGVSRDWNREIWDLYSGLAEKGDETWAETEQKRLRKTRPSLPRDEYLGTWESPLSGEIVIELQGRDMVLRTKKVSMPMSHWHLDTFLVEYEPWGIREFAEFRVGPAGKIDKLILFQEEFLQRSPGD